MSDKSRHEELISKVNDALDQIAMIADDAEFQAQLDYMARIEPAMRELILRRRRMFIGGTN